MEYSFSSMYDFLSQHILCGICYEPAFENVECYNCSSLYCTSCITELDHYYENLNNQHDETYRPKCPHCRANSRFYENSFVTKVLGQIELVCDYCHQNVRHINYENHLDSCLGKLVPCIMCGKRERTKLHQCKYTTCDDCQALIKKSDVKKHKKTCMYRPIHCEYCKSVIKFKDQFKHATMDCEMYPIICQFCKGTCMRKNLHQHVSVCDKAVMDCVICKTRYTRSEKHICPLDLCTICNGIYIKGYLSNHLNGHCETLTKHEKRIRRQKRRGMYPRVQEYTPFKYIALENEQSENERERDRVEDEDYEQSENEQSENEQSENERERDRVEDEIEQEEPLLDEYEELARQEDELVIEDIDEDDELNKMVLNLLNE